MTATLAPVGRSPEAGRDVGPARRRIALYSHDTLGLGHVRRNLAIASALARAHPAPDLLLVSGAREARAFALPARTDCLTLPAVVKTADGRYAPRSLGTSLDELIRLRSRTIAAALEAFRPDVLIVDKVARGQLGELEPALQMLRTMGTRIVLGLRDVLDDPVRARAEWHGARTDDALRAYYDGVWVYGDPHVFDPIRASRLRDPARGMATFTGYLAPRSDDARLPPALRRLDERPFVLCTVGGGQDGSRLAEAFCAAALPPGVTGVLVTGPYMDADRRAALAAEAAASPDREVVDFVDGCAPLIRRARAVIAMGGYNTAVELLAHARRALIVPRVRPRVEQLVRAMRLQAIGAADLCHPARLGPTALAEWMATAVHGPPGAPGPVDLDGLGRLPRLIDALCASRGCARASA